MKIFLDPGHGGSDTGWINEEIGLKEADVNLEIALLLGDILEKRGHTIRFSRETDINSTLKFRAKTANDWNANYYIAIHLNGADNNTLNGADILIFKRDSCAEGLAESIMRQLILQTGLLNRGIHTSSHAALRLTKMTAVLIEPAFITNPREADFLSKLEFKKRCTQGIADGFINFIKNS